jgi:hypothetical protein
MSASKDKWRKFLLGLGKEVALHHIKEELITLLTSTRIFFIVLDFCSNARTQETERNHGAKLLKCVLQKQGQKN